MLINFMLNVMDTFNIVYLWMNLAKRERNFLKLISSVIIISSLITATQQLELHFISVYIVDIIAIMIIYKSDFKNVIFGLTLTVLIIMYVNAINIFHIY